MFKKIMYLYSKLVLILQYPSIRDSHIDKRAKVGSRSNLIRVNMKRYSYIGSNNSITNTEIGAFCSIASYCAIGGGKHPIDWVSTSPYFYSKRSSLKQSFSDKNYIEEEKVKIGNDVWVGEKCFIKSGVTIGDGAIIGAHSVVTKDVPSYSIVVGSPAKVIRYRFKEEIIEELLKIEWWNLSEEKLKKYGEVFNDPIEFIKRYQQEEK